MNEIRHLIHSDPDFVDCPRCKNSISKAQDDYPNGFDDKQIARYLKISRKMLERLYQSAVKKLRKSFK